MKSAKEIEYKFLIDPETANKFIRENSHKLDINYITQTYLFIGSDIEFRLRCSSNLPDNTKKYFVTLKKNTLEDSTRDESELEISEKDADKYLGKGPTLEKIRYTWKDSSGQKFELDYFQRDLSGLYILETELDPETLKCPEGIDNLLPYPFLPNPFQNSKNITGDTEFKNKNLVNSVWATLMKNNFKDL